MTNILISGYYGLGNIGDEAILSGILNSISKQIEDVQFTVITNDPEDTRKLHHVSTVHQSFKSGIPRFLLNQVKQGELLKVNKAINNCDIFILGGGELLQDLRIHYLPILLSLVKTAQSKGKKTVIYGIGAGPIETRLGKSICKKVLDKADLVTVRDEKSKKALEGCGLKNVVRTVDPAFGIDLPSKEVLADKVNKLGVDSYGPAISTTLHNLLYDDDKYRKTKGKGIDLNLRRKIMAESYDYLLDQYEERRFQFLPTVETDLGGYKKIVSQMSHKSETAPHNSDFHNILAYLSASEMLIGMRLHSLILATQIGVPFIPLSYSSKARAYVEMLGMGDLYLDTEDIEKEGFKNRLLENYSKVYSKRKEYSNKLLEHSDKLRKKAFESGKLVSELVK